MNNEPPVVPLTPALAALMGEPGTRKIRGLVVHFDTIEEAQQWVLDVIEASTCLKELEILSDALTHEDPDEQVRTALARLDPGGDMIGARDARSWLRDMRHALRTAWRSCTYRTAIGHIAVYVGGLGVDGAFRSAFL